MFNRLIKNNNAASGGCTDIVDNYNPFGGGGVALYQLNGDATDESGNYNGTASNVTYGTGVFGQAAVFNGSSSYIRANSSVTSSGAFSASFWFNMQSLSGSYSPVILANTLSGQNGGFQVRINYVNDKIEFFPEGGGQGTLLSNVVPALNTWYHIVGTFDGSTFKLYVNNSLQTNTLTGTLTSNPPNDLYIGTNPSILTRVFDGSIDQVRIFSRALTPLEVEALYTEELCICDGTVDTLDILKDGSCIATYQLDGNANDLSGNYSGTPIDVSYGVGEFDLAGVFNGTSSQIEIAATSTTPVDVSQSNYSISLWVKTTPASAGQRLISKYANDDAFAPFTCSQNTNGTVTFAERGGSGGTVVEITTTTLTIDDNNWHHIVFIKSPTATSIYIDNSAFVNNNTHTQVDGGTTPWRIGRDNPSSPSYFEGSIDQVRIFNKALSSSEVTTLYNETACAKGACSGTTNTLDILGDSSCIAAYPLDGSFEDVGGNYNLTSDSDTGNVSFPRGNFDLSFASTDNNWALQTTGTNIPDIKSQGTADTYAYSVWVNTTDKNVQNYHLLTSPYNNTLISATDTLTPSADGKALMAAYNGSSWQYVKSTTVVCDGTWHHIVYNKTTTAFEIYVDGIFENSLAYASSTFNSQNSYTNNPDVIGRAGNCYLGQIDQVRIFNKALSAGEVTTLYNETPCN